MTSTYRFSEISPSFQDKEKAIRELAHRELSTRMFMPGDTVALSVEMSFDGGKSGESWTLRYVPQGTDTLGDIEDGIVAEWYRKQAYVISEEPA